tara:strand:+ start:1488 stop:1778 length:291 start_codon:yes stop_codon:yes gene_type:complete
MNSFILLETEKKRIQKLYEATTASSSGQFNQPMAFTEPVEVVDIETTIDGGDNLQADSLELSLDVDELMNLLNISEDDDEKRIRKIHKENSIIKKS